jgi:hypothetical protein
MTRAAERSDAAAAPGAGLPSVWAPCLTGVSLLTQPVRPVLAAIPWLVIACVYGTFTAGPTTTW